MRIKYNNLLILFVILALGLSACVKEPTLKLPVVELTAESGSSTNKLLLNTDGHEASARLVNPPAGISLLAGKQGKASSQASPKTCDLKNDCVLQIANSVAAGKYEIKFKLHLMDLNEDIDGTISLNVEAGIEIEGGDISLLPGERHVFKAKVFGSKNQAITWTASGGNIDKNGTYTAGIKSGVYEVIATTATEPVKKAKVLVSIKKTGLRVSVEPSDAVVTIFDPNNKKITEFSGEKEIIDISAGEYSLETNLKGYVSDSRKAVVEAGIIKNVAINLKISTSLNINVDPENTEYMIAGPNDYNKSFKGDQLITDIKSGEYSIAAQATGYISKTFTIVVKDNEAKNVEIALLKGTGIDLKPVLDLGDYGTTQPVGTIIRANIGATGYEGKNVGKFTVRYSWKRAGSAKFFILSEFTVDGDKKLRFIKLPDLAEGENTFRIEVDINNVIKEDDEKNNVLDQILVGTQKNTPPSVTLSANKNSGAYPLTVKFSAKASSQSGKISSYEWDFNGDGVIDKKGTAVENYIYTDNGIYRPKVIVTDDSGLKASSKVTISVSAPSDGQVPIIQWISPNAEEIITSPHELKVQVDSVDVAKVEYRLGSKLLADKIASPYTYNWKPSFVDNGVVTLSAKACDVDGCSDVVTVSVTVDVANRALWVKTLAGQPLADPIIASSKVYGAYDIGKIFNLDAGGGLWESNLGIGEAVFNEVAVDESNSIEYISGKTGKLYAVSLTNDGVLWSKQIGTSYGSSNPPQPLVVSGLVYAIGGTNNNCLKVFDSGGTEVVTSPFCVSTTSNLSQGPIDVGGNLFVVESYGGTNAKIHKVSVSGSLIASSSEISAFLSDNVLSSDGSKLILASKFQKIWKISSSNLSTSSISSGAAHNSTIVSSPNCYAFYTDGNLVCLNKVSGTKKWEAGADASDKTVPVYDAQRGVFYVVSLKGLVKAIKEDSGDVLWEYDLDELNTSSFVVVSPVIVEDTLVIIRYQTAIGLNLNY